MPRILVVDDEVQIRELLRDALTSAGCDVVSTPTVAQALATLSTRTVDLVVLDLCLPEGSGASLLNEIRQAHNAVPVVIYSGSVTSELEKELRTAGATEVLNKAGGVSVLVRQIRTILQSSNRAARPAMKAQDQTVLIVDDEAAIRRLLRDFFETKRYRVLEAANGEQAVDLVKQQTPSVVLLDVEMPGMDGLATLSKLLELHPKLGVVMATGQRDEPTVKKAIELGAYGYVLKPFDMLYLQLVVLSKLTIATAGSGSDLPIE